MEKEKMRLLLVKTTKEMLLENQSPDEITSRAIAAKANVNLAMINYCFKSKDELLVTAINQIIQESAENPLHFNDTTMPPLDRLWTMLWHLCELVLKFSRFTKSAIPFILLQSNIESPLYILPILREYYGLKKSETECRVIAYQLISFMQLVFYRSDDFKIYAGLNLSDLEGCKELLQMQFNLFFKEGYIYD